MSIGVLIVITLCCITWSLWIRRVTWGCRWEVAATLNIALQGAAVFLMSPFASETIGQVLHSLTGTWNLEDYIGHDCYIVAASAIVYNALGRLQEDEAMQEGFKQYVERPATLCIPLLLATFSVGNGAAIYRPDFFDVPTDFWLSALLAAALRHADLPAGLRVAGAADLAPGPPFAADRQHLPAGLGQRCRRLRDPHHHGLRAAAPSTSRAAGWCGSSPARAAPVSPWPRHTPGGSRRSGSSGRPTDPGRRPDPADRLGRHASGVDSCLIRFNRQIVVGGGDGQFGPVGWASVTADRNHRHDRRTRGHLRGHRSGRRALAVGHRGDLDRHRRRPTGAISLADRAGTTQSPCRSCPPTPRSPPPPKP